MDYELPMFPDGSKGLFVRAYRLNRNKREKENTITVLKVDQDQYCPPSENSTIQGRNIHC